MAPQETESIPLLEKGDESTQVFCNDNGATFVICNSDKQFKNPTVPAGTKPEDVLKTLNLDLGQKFVNANSSTLIWVIKILDSIFLQPFESILFKLWKMIPLSARRALTFGSWKIYFRLHKYLLGRRTGMHPSQSEEYHALTTVMWWTRLFPISPKRMRFSLSQLYVCTPNVVKAHRVETIEQEMPLVSSSDLQIPACQKEHATVRGLFLHQKEIPTEHTIFWVYGGAYLAGDPLGNSSAADWVARETGMDVFCPEFRLAPDGDIEDVLWDVCLAYKWLLSMRTDPSKIFLLGISSGAAIAIRLMQLIAEQQQGETTLPDYIPKLGSQPKGAVLFGPYIDYTDPKKGTFLHYPRLDLVVNESVQNHGLPYLDDFIPDGRRKDYSPVYGSMKGLPPVCVVVSEHEAVYDMTIEFVNQARAEGVSVTIGVWKYMCHVFSFLWGFVPEGRQSLEFARNWLRVEAGLSNDISK